MKNAYNFQVHFPSWLKALTVLPFKNNRWCAVWMVCCLPLMVQASPDFSIFYNGTSIQLSDQMGGNDVISVTEVAGSIRFDVPGRTYAINGGLTLPFPVSITLAGANTIVVFAGEGNDVVNIGAFTTVLPNFSVNGAEGDDVINFNGDINFLANANLDANLQDDANSIGVDKIVVGVGVNLRLAGTGNAMLKASQSIVVLTGGSVETDDGNLTVEANQQAAPSAGNFRGVDMTSGLLDVAGDGYLTVKGRGGNNIAGFQHGVSLALTSKISGGDINAVNVQGWGGANTGIRNYGVVVETNSEISSSGASITVIGNGNGTG
ncbi:MAG: hypothetical protein H7246_14520, partial [Phycisphaerae bacterium]|nr:hypothetical protein [Saprospiraceae bacterium]